MNNEIIKKVNEGIMDSKVDLTYKEFVDLLAEIQKKDNEIEYLRNTIEDMMEEESEEFEEDDLLDELEDEECEELEEEIDRLRKDLKEVKKVSERGSVRKMRIYNVKSIFPAYTKGLQTFVSICNLPRFFF
ncbi:hypothetical protein [Clostridium perfringens]|uniref:hypothetical protein n=1 Tax=Clostridium perfringens TaxID=1502 RepID=UPI00224561D2|nr:hypothetical protein [Clostridium perfringens]